MPLSEFLNRFRTVENCRDYLAAQRWQDGFICPKCGHKHGCHLSNGLYQCTHCHHQTSVTAGTVLHHSKFLYDVGTRLQACNGKAAVGTGLIGAVLDIVLVYEYLLLAQSRLLPIMVKHHL